ncbi:putative histidine kinase-group viii protein [Botrytis fragariae]|uniref:Putative histidine kinase-group viii protein n=1 Tax=Botrytis fragariae TaxID=1964551 RepID=A0A8H6AI59_9HELO|nr:putative histidine kinase-group viii protein [Botrytis fragariae]KAF5868223.1 putative histidine kinase-group viii protein [Botrytis fragariae]
MAQQPSPIVVNNSGSIDIITNDQMHADGSLRIERVFPIRIETESVLDTKPNDSVVAKPQEVSDDTASTNVPVEVPETEGGINQRHPNVVLAESCQPLSPSQHTFVTTSTHHLISDSKPTPNYAINEIVRRCEDEPIQIPGSIQSFGALLALEEKDDGRFLVRIASENSKSIIGCKPEDLFALPCFTQLLSPVYELDFRARIESRKLWHQKEHLKAYPDIFTMMLESIPHIPMYCALHFREDAGLFICEFEAKNDLMTDVPPENWNLPGERVNIIDNQATEEERIVSTTKYSEPFRTIQRTKHRLGEMEMFHLGCEVQEQLNSATSIESLLDVVVGLVFDLTGFHRVMAYQFDEDDAGLVRAEYIDERASLDLYRGLKFPNTDIPIQARQLYALNKIRLLYDRTEKTARLMSSTEQYNPKSLNLSSAYLRAMSPVHIKYLTNMGVRASFSISLIVEGRLWGLISCHDYGLEGKRVSFPMRELCRSLGDCTSNNIEKLIYLSRIQARRHLGKAPPKTSPSQYVAASSRDLLQMFEADFGFLAIKDEARTIGRLYAYNESISLLQYIRKKSHTSVFHTQNISADCTDIMFPARFVLISGFLVIPLSLSGSDFLVFFRKGQLKEVKWAGNPNEKIYKPGTQYLEPRASFKRWSQHVIGTSREWTREQVESAGVLSALYGRFIEVWRQKEAIVQQNRMTRLLIRQAGAEVRNPLNAIIGYLEIALEEVLDDQARLHLEKSLGASRSLIFVVNDLLNLTEAEGEDPEMSYDNVVLAEMMNDVIDDFGDECQKKSLNIRFAGSTDIPAVVKCDGVRLRQTITNLLSNTVKHSTAGDVVVGLKNVESDEDKTRVEMFFTDNGSGFTEPELDGIFQDFEKVLDDDEDEDEQPCLNGEKSSIGLGLAVAARFVRLNDGKIVINTEPGHGTTVTVSIPFRKSEGGHHFAARASRENAPNSSISAESPSSESPSSENGIQCDTPERFQVPPPTPLKEPFLTSTAEINESPSSIPTPSTCSHSSLPLSTPLSTKSVTTNPDYQLQYPFPIMELPPQPEIRNLNVLVAEDNPLNSRLLEERLRKRGHVVTVKINGQACAEAVMATPDGFDIVLMDIQMPILNGFLSTTLIRSFLTTTSPLPLMSPRAKIYGRLPIIAVSASLEETKRDEYIDRGFDGWILKPIDFRVLEEMLKSVEDEGRREGLVYGREGVKWSKGGWLRLKG